MIHLLDVVYTTEAIPKYGTVVEILANGEAFEVEFIDRYGHARAVVTLRRDQIDIKE